MNTFSKFLDKIPKKSKAAAYDIESSKKMEPPEFNVTSQHSNVIQTKNPGPSPIPIPYPNIATSDVKAKGKVSSNSGGLLGSIGSGIQGISEGVQNITSKVSENINETSDAFNGNVSDYINAVIYGKNMFKLQARFKDIKIMGVSAIGPPGCLDGPSIESYIKVAPTTAAMIGQEKDMAVAIAKGVSANFENWRQNVMVPGLPWYPAFAAFPGPHAPPTPNVPTPLIACPSSSMSKITVASELKASIYGNLPSNMKNSKNEAFVEVIAAQLSMHFLMWIFSQQIMMVMGKGPIPSYAPPASPVGPVVGGDILSVPGHLMS